MATKRYNIGLVIGNIEDDFSNAICKGAIEAAEELDDNLFILPVKYFYDSKPAEPLMRYEYQYNSLLSYAQVSSLDIILIPLSSICFHAAKEQYNQILASFKGYPIILIACDEPGHSCIRYNNSTALAEGIKHLITVEHRKKIAMITADLSNLDSQERLETYKQTLEEYNYPVLDSYITVTAGDFRSTPDVEAFFNTHPDVDAIVCGNDSIAECVYSVLQKFHKKIGEDISVIGFDDLVSAKYMDPPLATVRANAAELGFRAVLQGHRKLLDGTVNDPETFFVDTKFIYRDSIGTNSTDKISTQKQLDEQDRLFEKGPATYDYNKLIKMNHNMNILSRNMLMLDDNEEQNHAKILEYLSTVDLKSCFLFTYKKPIPHHCNDTWKKPNSLHLRAYLEDDIVHTLRRSEQLINVNNIYDHQFMPDKRKTYVMIDFYAREFQYGFMLCDISYSNFHYVEFLCYQISIAIKLMHMFDMQRSLLKEQDTLLQRLQKENLQLDAIAEKDELTGILNRRGFYKKIGLFLEHEKSDDMQIIFAYADLNYLKQINDQYGHSEGDFALCACANAFETIFPNCIAGRIGGDEFAVLSVCSKEVTKASLSEAINTYLSQMAATANKPYSITVSLGIWSPENASDFQLETAIDMADALLYEEKKRKPPFKHN